MGLSDRLKEMRRERKLRKFLEPIVQRTVIWTFMVIGLCLKALPYSDRWMPVPRIREFLNTWSAHMMWVVVKSGGRRMYIDMPCTLQDPPDYQPKFQTAPEFQLTEADIKQFYEQGFLGPITLCSPEEMAEIREQMLKELEQPSKLFGIKTMRDRHLDCPTVYNFANRAGLADRMAQILGPDLMMWRTQAFMKQPGMAGFTFHQASCFLTAEGFRCVLKPPNLSELFELSAWVAFDDVDLENGCVQLIKGSHRKIRTIKLGGTGGDDEAFVNARFTLEMDIKPEDVVTMQMKAGQFFLFTERTVHGSPANKSNRRRWGMAFRVVRPNTKIYEGARSHKVQYIGDNYDLSKWGGIMLRGEDRFRYNRHATPPTPAVAAAPPPQLVGAGT